MAAIKTKEIISVFRLDAFSINKSTGLPVLQINRWLENKECEDYTNYTMNSFLDTIHEEINNTKRKLNLL